MSTEDTSPRLYKQNAQGGFTEDSEHSEYDDGPGVLAGFYARSYYGVPACIGRLIDYDGKPGIIAEDRGNYIGVNFDADKPGVVCNVHPTDEKLSYLGMGVVRRMTRSQARYKRYEKSESDESFGEWLKRGGGYDD